MSASPLWLGAERPLFGWVHAPEGGRAAGGVVLCPPLGYEGTVAHRTFRRLAERLADAGLVALRFDYDGTGDSAGDQRDPDRVAAWRASVVAAAEVVRETGVPWLALVGMRLGATLAADVAATARPDALVLWDPAWSGRSAVRRLRALQLLGIGAAGTDESVPGSMDVAGDVLTAETLTGLRALQIDPGALPARTLVLTRPDQPPPHELDRLADGVQVADATGQDRLVDRLQPAAAVPHEAIDTIVRWLSAEAPGAATTIAAPAGADAASIGGGVVERFASLGPLGLFGIVAERDGGADPDRPVVVLVNNGTSHHVGPSRLWVDWGRDLAARGFAVARVDISGVGDSPVRPGQRIEASYPAEAADDLVALTTALDRGQGVVLGGLCSGAYHAMTAPPEVPLRTALLINVAVHVPVAVLRRITNDDADPDELVRVNRHRRYWHRLLVNVPAPVWRALDAVGAVPAHTRPLRDLVARGVDVVVAYGSDDFHLRRLRLRSAWQVADLQRSPGFRFETVDDLDHALMAPGPRRRLIEVLTSHLLQRYGDVDLRATTWNHRASDVESPVASGPPGSLG